MEAIWWAIDEARPVPALPAAALSFISKYGTHIPKSGMDASDCQ
jgi:hypothetical protein